MINAGVSILAFDGSQSYNASTKEWVNVKLKVNYPEGQDINVNPVSTGDYIFEPSGLIWRVQSVSKSGDIFITRLQVKYRAASEDIAPGFGITARGAITTPSVKNHLSDLHIGVVAEDAHRLMMTALPTIVQGRLMLDSDKSKLDRLDLDTNGDINLTNRRLYWEENSDSAEIGFHNTSDAAESYMYFLTSDNGNEYFRWLHRTTAGTSEWMRLQNGTLRINGQVVYHENNLPLVGSVAFFARNSAPSGWLKCNGATISRTSYSALFSQIGTTFGAGNGSTTFRIPDLRGEFIRGWDDGRGVDSGRGFGSWQGDLFRRHTHNVMDGSGGDRTNSITLGGGNFSGQDRSTSWRSSDSYNLIQHTGGAETRPRNIALLACIKY